jgi:hypothetical protein
MLAYKLIVRMGLIRSCPEDFLVATDLMQKFPEHAKKVDLRDELKAVVSSSGSGAVSNSNIESEDKTNSSTQFKWDTIGVLNCLPMTMKPYNKNIETHDDVCTDGKFFYWKCDQGLFKASIGDFNSLSFKIVAKNTECLSEAPTSRMLYHNGKLFVRHSVTTREKPFIVINAQNLELIEDYETKVKDPNDEVKSDDEGDKEESTKPVTILRDEKADKKSGRIL